MILVTGASGTVGTEVLGALVERKAKCRALARNETAGAKLKKQFGERVEIVIGDYAEPKTLTAALEGVDSIYLLSPATGDLVENESNVINAAQKTAVRYVVYHSVMGADDDAAIELFRHHRQSEKHIESASDLGYTILRPNSFMQNLTNRDAAGVAQTKAFHTPIADAPISYIDARDIAAVAAVLLTSSKHNNQTYELTGLEAVNYHIIARELSKLLGSEISVENVTDEAAREQMKSEKMPAALINDFLKMFGIMREGGAQKITNAVEQITGKLPRLINAFLAENSEAFVARAATTPS